MSTVMIRRTALSCLTLGALLLTGGVSAHEKSCGDDAFTVAVISDTQNYVDYTYPQPGSFEPYQEEMSYLADHGGELNLAFVTHVGDVVQHGDGTNGTPGDVTYGAGVEWDLAAEAMSILAGTGGPAA